MKRKAAIDKATFSAPGMPGGQTGARHADRELGAWLTYQMKLRGVTQEEIAAKLKVTRQMVQRVAYGVSTSARTQKAIAQALGHKNWSELLAQRMGVAA